MLSIQRLQNQNIGDQNKPVIKILAVGESTTAGIGPHTWPAELEKNLNSNSKEFSFIVYNEGVGGVNTLYIVSRIENLIKRYDPDFVISMMGVNDEIGLIYKYINSSVTKEDETKQNYEYIETNKTSFSRIKRFFNLFSYSSEELCKKYYEEAESEFKKSNLKNARRMYVKALNICSHKAPVYTSLGYLNLISGYREKAEEMYLKSIENDPHHWQAYLELGEIYRFKQEYNKSISLYKNALLLFPNNTQIMNGLGYSYYKNNQTDLAEEILRKSTELSNEDDFGFELLGRIAKNDSSFFLKKAIEINRNVGISFRSKLELSEHEETKRITIEGYEISFDNKKEENYLVTKAHYLKMYELSKKYNVTYIVMQYPTLTIKPLMDFFPPEKQKDILFISNEENFKKALEKQSYDSLFIDNFGSVYPTPPMFIGDYGHTTVQGNKLIAENTAKVILKYLNEKN